jgi:hypothetical protein
VGRALARVPYEKEKKVCFFFQIPAARGAADDVPPNEDVHSEVGSYPRPGVEMSVVVILVVDADPELGVTQRSAAHPSL